MRTTPVILAILLAAIAPAPASGSLLGRVCRRVERTRNDPTANRRAVASMLRWQTAIARRCGEAPRPTRRLALGGNLYAGAFVQPFVNDGTLGNAFATSSFTTQLNVVGTGEEVRGLFGFFSHVGPQTWTVHFGLADGEALRIVSPPDQRLLFDGDGRIVLGRTVRLDATGGELRPGFSVDLSGLTQLPTPGGISCVVQDGCLPAS